MRSLVASTCGFLLIAGSATAQRADGQFWPCNPTLNATGACTPNPGLPTNKYEIDFTKIKAIPSDWTISNYATISFGANGAEFTFNKRYDAPQLWTNFFVFFGKVDVEMRIASGTGMISSAVLISDDFDEIDFEFSGNNFGNSAWSAGKGQCNYFGKGITGYYDRGQFFDVSKPQDTFHTYSVEWRKAYTKWGVDGKVFRTFNYADSSGDKGDYQYPQTPSKLQLGIWAGGDPGQNAGTKSWAGGETDINGGPYTMFVKKVTIHSYNPAYAYNYTDQSGKWQSIQLLQDPNAKTSNVSVTVKPPSVDIPTSISSGSSSSSKTSSSSSSVKSSTTSSKSSSKSSSSSTSKKSSSSSAVKSTLTTPKPTSTRTITTTKKVTTTSLLPAAYGKKASTTTKIITYTSKYKVVGTKTYSSATTTATGYWNNWGGYSDGWWTTDADGKAEYVGAYNGRGGAASKGYRE